MINRAYKFECDSCGEWAIYIAENIAEAKQEARADAWKMHAKRGCFCSQECYLKVVAEWA